MTKITTINLSNNSLDDEAPSISGNKVGWSQWQSTNYDAMYHNGTKIIDLGYSSVFSDQDIDVSGTKVVWVSKGLMGQSDIYQYDGSNTINLSGDYTDILYNSQPQVSGNNVVWVSDEEIYLFNGTQAINLSNNNLEDVDPRISGGKVAWSGWDGNNWEIYFYNGTKTIKLTNNSKTDDLPQISGNKVVWNRWDGNDWEIYFYNGTKTIQLTNNNYNDEYPSISGNNVVWSRFDGQDTEIYFYNGSKTTKLTNDNYNDATPKISDNKIAWWSWDGNDGEIYCYDGSSVIQVTNNNYEDTNLDFSGNKIVWQGWDGNDWEIYKATLSQTTSLSANDVITNFNNTPENERLLATKSVELINNDVGESLFTSGARTPTFAAINDSISGDNPLIHAIGEATYFTESLEQHSSSLI